MIGFSIGDTYILSIYPFICGYDWWIGNLFLARVSKRKRRMHFSRRMQCTRKEADVIFRQAGKGFSNQEDQKNRDVVFYIFLKRNLLHRAALGWEHEAALYGKRKVFGMEPSGGM